MVILLSFALAVLSVVTVMFFVRNLRKKRQLAAMQEQFDQAKAEHVQAMEERTRLDQVKDEFIATVSHELRTPLTSVRGALGLLSAGLLGNQDPKAQNLLRIALGNTDRLIRLINDILDLEKMESGRAMLDLRPCRLREIIASSIEDVAPMALTHHVTIRNIEPELPTDISADPDRIGQVVTNLLSNAIKFSPPEATILITTHVQATTLILRIVDQGRGIPPEKIELIFERFQQVEAADARQKGGTGLGLAISRSIVEQHHGRIWAEVNETVGSSFFVQIPRSKRTDPIFEDALVSIPRTFGGRSTVLVCDDDSMIRAVVREQLERKDYIVVEATCGEQALSFARQHTVNAILLDLNMPGLSGWETLTRLTSDPLTAEIPVVILSVASPGIQPSLTHVAQGWVQKPYHQDLLLGELARVLQIPDGPTRILLVEDDADLAVVIQECFGRNGIDVMHASTQQQAAELCVSHPPHLMLLDLTLPDGDGLALIKALRKDPALRPLPVVVYSGREFTDQEVEGLDLGPTQFLTKAKVHVDEVESIVLAMIQRPHSPMIRIEEDLIHGT